MKYKVSTFYSQSNGSISSRLFLSFIFIGLEKNFSFKEIFACLRSIKTPGVYVDDITLFSPPVAEVETAIPVFIGYAEKAIEKGVSL